MNESSTTHVPVKIFANLFGVSPRWVQQLAQNGVIPKAKKGRYPLVASIRGYVGYLQELGQRQDSPDVKSERARLLKAQADKIEFEVATMEKELLSGEVVEKVWTRIVTTCRTRILAIPEILAAQLVGIHEYREAESIIRTVLYEALTELAGHDFTHDNDGDCRVSEDASDAADYAEI